MIHIKLSDRRPVGADDPMGRDWVGYDPTASLEELFDRNRGRWRLARRANREKHVLFSYTGDHRVKFVAAIESLERSGARRVIIGHVLAADDPVSRAWVGAPAPDSHRNPATYVAEREGEGSTCACGCGEPVSNNRSFLPGHDQRAVHSRIARRWGGTLGFIEWFDAAG